MSRARLADLAVFVVALALRLAYVVEHETVLGLDVSELPQTDNHVFVNWARTIAAGDVLCRDQPHAWHLWTQEVAPEGRWLEWYGGPKTFHQSPLYPYLVAAIFVTLGDEHLIVGLVQAVLGALACALTCVLGRRLVNPRTGLLAGLMLALCAPFYFYDAFVLRDGLVALLVVVATLAVDRAVQRGRAGDWLAAGAALGLFTLGKETGTALLGATLLGAVWTERARPRRALLAAGMLAAGWLLLTSPAFLRNVEVGAPTFRLSTRGPEVLVAGNARGQDGVSWDPPVDTLRTILMESNFSIARAGLATIATHRSRPLGFVELVWNKTSAFFNGYEVPNNVNFYLHRAHLASLKAGFVTVTFLGPASLIGLLVAWPRRRRLAVAYLMFAALSASVIALYILARFRLQVLPFLAIFAALALDWAARRWGDGRQVAVIAMAIPFALLTRWCWADSSVYTDLNKNTSIMLMHLKVGNVDQAERYRDLQRSAIAEAGLDLDESFRWRWSSIEEAFASFAMARAQPQEGARHHVLLGDAYQSLVAVTKRGEKVEMADLARAAYRRALEIAPDVVGAHHGLGRVAGLLEDDRAAVVEFRAELALHPDHGPSHKDLGTILFNWGDQPLGALLHFERALMAGASDARLLASAARLAIDPELRGQAIRLGPGIPAYDPVLGLARARRALELARDDPFVLDQAGVVLYACGASMRRPALVDEAVALTRRVAELQPWRAAHLATRAASYADYRARMADAGAGAPPPAPPSPGAPAPDAPTPDAPSPDAPSPDGPAPDGPDPDAGSPADPDRG